MLLEDGVDQRVLGREPPVQRSHADARAVCDLLDAHVDADLGKGHPSGGEDPLAILPGVAPKGPFGDILISGGGDPLMVG